MTTTVDKCGLVIPSRSRTFAHGCALAVMGGCPPKRPSEHVADEAEDTNPYAPVRTCLRRYDEAENGEADPGADDTRLLHSGLNLTRNSTCAKASKRSRHS